LVRGAQRLEDYVNDRPYVSSSYLTVALGRIFGTALAKTMELSQITILESATIWSGRGDLNARPPAWGFR
jgi:hypothetical protein